MKPHPASDPDVLRREAETKLAASERHLRAIFETEPECVKLLAADGSLLEMNPAGLRMLEADSFQQVENYCVYPLVAEAHRAAFRELTEKVFRGESGILQFQLTGLKGGRRWLESHATPLHDATGKITALLGITRDITTRKAAEDALRARELSYSTLLKNIAGAVYRCRNDPDWTVDFISDGCFELTGYQPDEIVNSRVTSLGAITHPEDTAAVREKCQANLAAHRACSNEYRITHRNGETRWVWDQAQGIYSPSGELLCIEGLLTDISARKQAEAALRASEERFSKAFRLSPDAIILWRLSDGHITDVNDSVERLSGFKREELIGRGGWESNLWVKREDRDRYVNAIVERRRLDPFEAEFRIKSGAHRLGLVAGEFLELGGEAHALAIIQDITERKQAEDKIRQSEAKFRSLAEESLAGVVIIQDGRFKYVNPAAAGIMDVPAAELLAVPNVFALVAEADRPRVEENLRRLAVEVPSLDLDFRVRKKDGSLVDLEAFGSRIQLEGRPAVLSTVLDITARRRVEAELRESETRFRTIIEASPVAMAMNDEHQNITFLNRKFVETFGYTLAEIPTLAAWWPRAYPDPAYRHRVMEEWQAAVVKAQRDKTGFEPREYDVTGKDGVVRCIQFNTAKLDNSDLVIFYDLTERKRAETRLRALGKRLAVIREEERTRIARVVHDDLGQELIGLKMDLAWMERRLATPGRTGTATLLAKLKTILSNVDDSIVTVKRVATQLRPRMLDELGLAAALEWLAGDFQARSGVRCEYESFSEPYPLTPFRKSAFFGIAQESLRNVAQHAKATRVVIGLTTVGPDMVLTVQDNGRGITDSELSAAEALGILGMKERADSIDGRFEIKGVPGQGTRITVSARLEEPETKKGN